MARTITLVHRNIVGNRRDIVVDVNITSYTNPGGENIAPQDVGLKEIMWADLGSYSGRPTAFTYPAAGSPLNNGKILVTQDNGTATAAALPEVPNTTNLGTMRCRFLGVA